MKNFAIISCLIGFLVSGCASHDATVMTGTAGGAAAGAALCGGSSTLGTIACSVAGGGVGHLLGEQIAHNYDHYHRHNNSPIYVIEIANVNHYVQPRQANELTRNEWQFWNKMPDAKCHSVEFVMPTTRDISLGHACPTREGYYEIKTVMPRDKPYR